MENVATYSEARSEYTKQLATFVVPPIVNWFQTLWVRSSTDRQRSLSTFQTECEEVARWNQDRINDEVRVLLERSGCDYMEELMTAVFIAHTKVLTAIRLTTKQKKLSLVVPKLDHFIHRIFRESARSFWKSPFLFMTEGGVVERQKNILQIEGLAIEAITTAVRGLLPVKQILNDYLGDEGEVPQEEKVDAVEETAEETVEEKTVETKPVEAKPVADSNIKEIEPASPEKEEVKESEPVSPANTVVKEAEAEPETETAVEKETPAVVNIDTEPTVRFSDTVSVFDEVKGGPELVAAPDYESDGLKIDDATVTTLAADDMEDLDAPVSEVVVLE